MSALPKKRFRNLHFILLFKDSGSKFIETTCHEAPYIFRRFNTGFCFISKFWGSGAKIINIPIGLIIKNSGVAQIIKWEQALEKGEDIEAEVAKASLPEKY